ncbi:MAG: tetratricopeptide repeat protein [Armatimonadota bacterium]|nr:tetratricopeptide repeat protein [bacterium]
MNKYMCSLLICFALWAAVSSSAFSQQQIPPESLDKLQNIFADVRDRLWEVNDEFWHSGEYERCIATMRLIVQIDPHDIDAYDNTAWLMQNDFRDEEAEAFLKEGLANNTDRYDMYFNLGYFLYMHERYDEAVQFLTMATAFDPPNFVWHSLAHAYEHAGRTTEALDLWATRIQAEPDDPVATNQFNRMLKGGPQSDTPAMMSRWREERKRLEKGIEN